MNDPNYYNRDVFSGPGVNVEDRDVETTDSVDDTADGSVVATDAETEPRIGDEDVTDEEEAAAQAAQLDADIADEDRLDAEDSAADDEEDSDDDDEDAEDEDEDDSLDAEDSLDDDDDEDDDLDGDIVAESDEDDDDGDDAEADADAVATLDEDDDDDEAVAETDGEIVALDSDDSEDDDEAVAETDGEVVALDSDDSEDDDEDDADEDDEDEDDDALAESDDEIVAAADAAVLDQDEDDDDTADEAAGHDASVVGIVPVPMVVDEVSVPESVVDEAAPMIPAQSTPVDGVPAMVSGGMHPGDADTMVETATTVGSSDLNDRMQQAQLTFIDDPRGATEAARTLANEAIEAQIAALRASTGHLDSWSGEEAPDTEVLRAAMRAYRDVITKLSAE